MVKGWVVGEGVTGGRVAPITGHQRTWLDMTGHNRTQNRTFRTWAHVILSKTHRTLPDTIAHYWTLPDTEPDMLSDMLPDMTGHVSGHDRT